MTKKDEEVWIPLISDKNLPEIHPAIDFYDKAYVGVWINSRNEKGDKIRKKLYFLTNRGLVSLKDLEKNNIFLKTRPVPFESRMTYKLLRINSQVEFRELIDIYLDYKDILFSLIKNKKNIYLQNLQTHQVKVKFKVSKEPIPSQESNLYMSKSISTLPTNSTKKNSEKNSTKQSSSIYQTLQTLPKFILTTYNNISTNSTNSTKTMRKSLMKLLFLAVFNKFFYYIDADPDTQVLLSLWNIGTYFFPLFNAYPYIYLGGTKQSGKTTVLLVTNNIAFNAIPASNISVSSAFRLIDGLRPTLLLDETDSLSQAKNHPELRQILLGGYKNGTYIYRATQSGPKVDFNVQRFEIYSPKMLANIRGLDDVLEDRAIPIILRRTKNKVFGDRSSELMSDDEFFYIRDLCYLNLLFNWKRIKKIYETMENETNLKSREWELWKPLLCIAAAVDEAVYKRILRFSRKKSKEKLIENLTEQYDTLLMRALVELVEENAYYKLTKIKSIFANQFEEDQQWINSKWIGRALKRLGFSNKRTVNGRREYLLKVDDVIDMAERLGLNINEIMREKKKQEQKTIEDSIPFDERLKGLKESGTVMISHDALLEHLTEQEINKAISQGLIQETSPGKYEIL